MGLTKTTKQGFERYFINADFSAVCETGETIDEGDVVITAVDNEGEDAVAAIVDETTLYVDGFKVYVRIIDGVAASSPYKVTFQVETSLGNRWEVEGLILVKEL